MNQKIVAALSVLEDLILGAGVLLCRVASPIMMPLWMMTNPLASVSQLEYPTKKIDENASW